MSVAWGWPNHTAKQVTQRKTNANVASECITTKQF
jgi:hypothetical protein